MSHGSQARVKRQNNRNRFQTEESRFIRKSEKTFNAYKRQQKRKYTLPSNDE